MLIGYVLISKADGRLYLKLNNIEKNPSLVG